MGLGLDSDLAGGAPEGQVRGREAVFFCPRKRDRHEALGRKLRQNQPLPASQHPSGQHGAGGELTVKSFVPGQL